MTYTYTTTEDKLDTLFKMQTELSTLLTKEKWKSMPVDLQVSHLCTALMHETVELQRLTNWKWWKTPVQFKHDAATEELIDIWHFVIDLSLHLGLTPDDIVTQYKKKHKINVKRQKEGY